jgi:membrane-anchored protein YejM (alkaline phosphatase superfamily)
MPFSMLEGGRATMISWLDIWIVMAVIIGIIIGLAWMQW